MPPLRRARPAAMPSPSPHHAIAHAHHAYCRPACFCHFHTIHVIFTCRGVATISLVGQGLAPSVQRYDLAREAGVGAPCLPLWSSWEGTQKPWVATDAKGCACLGSRISPAPRTNPGDGRVAP